jgi:hypothetical protein
MKVEYHRADARPASSIPQSLPKELGFYEQLITLFMVLRSIDEQERDEYPQITSYKYNNSLNILIYEVKTATPPISVPASAMTARFCFQVSI